MKRYIFCLLVGVFMVLSASAKSNLDSAKLITSKGQFVEINDSLRAMKNELVSFKKENESEKERLKQNMEIAQDTIENQNALIDGFHVIYVIITLLAAILLPIVTYFFSIRPSRKALRDFKKNTDKKFEDYIRRLKEKEITDNIISLENGDALYERIIMDSLIKLTYSDLNFEQRHKLSSIVSRKNINDLNKNHIKKIILNLILYKNNSDERNPIANDFVVNYAIRSSDLDIKNDGINYLKDEKAISFSTKVEIFCNLIFNSRSQCSECENLFLQVVSLNAHFIVEIINRKNLIDAIIEEERKKIISELQDYKYEQIRGDINKSYLFTHYNK